LVKSTDKEGDIKIKASSESLKSDVITVKTIKTDIEQLSKSLPDENLPSYTEKGPTPTTPSFKKTRIPVAIIGAKTASNQADAIKSYDDNELTQWSYGENDKAMIEYELEREANINQVVMKLAGWKGKKYPIRIFVDNKKVFEGPTPTSLGYVTIDITPTKGKKVQIELLGSAKDSDAINLVEITGKIDDAGLTKGGKTIQRLPIVEVEFYEPIHY
jgi:hypothetical protein